VETRFGTLNFFDGFPDKPSVEKLYDNLDFQRVVRLCVTRRHVRRLVTVRGSHLYTVT
jgi:hypothetical protein